jgi:precorrin-3B methylase
VLGLAAVVVEEEEKEEEEEGLPLEGVTEALPGSDAAGGVAAEAGATAVSDAAQVTSKASTDEREVIVQRGYWRARDLGARLKA